MKINRVWEMPNSRTFKIKAIKEIIEKYSYGVVIDPFANSNKLATITNDLDEQHETDYHMDATDFLSMFDDESVDVVLYDPPYSPRQVAECYKSLGKTVNMQTTQASYWGKQKEQIGRIVNPGGYVITCSWNSGDIGKKHGFEIVEILMVAHGGWHNDTIVVVEQKKGGITMGVRENLQDKCNLEDLAYDDKIEYWHAHETGNSLREFLSMTEEEYLDFVLEKDRKRTGRPKTDVREKLVELLYECVSKNMKPRIIGEKLIIEIAHGDIANHLIAHGVTFATDSGADSKWISVNDRLPEVTGSYLVCTDKDKVCTSKFYIDLPTGLRYEDPHWNNPSMNKHITHWAFLPEPPERKRND